MQMPICPTIYMNQQCNRNNNHIVYNIILYSFIARYGVRKYPLEYFKGPFDMDINEEGIRQAHGNIQPHPIIIYVYYKESMQYRATSLTFSRYNVYVILIIPESSTGSFIVNIHIVMDGFVYIYYEYLANDSSLIYYMI